MIIVDEGNFVDENVYLQALFPVCQQKGTILIILTTPLGLDNATSRLFDKRDASGEHIIHTVRIGASCSNCRAARILCKHNEGTVGEGLSRKKRDKFWYFYNGGNEHVALREYGGEPGDSGHAMFNNKWLLNLAQRETHPLVNVAKFIMIGIDPAQGGGCEWGLCACYFDHISQTQVIIYMDTCHLESVSTTNIMLYIKKSINAIRLKHAYFSSIPILIACEAAPSVIAENIASSVQLLIQKSEVYNVHMMYELPNGRPGVPKTHENTQLMVRYGQILLENNQVAFSSEFGTSTATASGNDEECIKAKLIKQISQVQRKVIPTARRDGKLTYRLDGKGGGGQNDDLFVAWAMIYYWYYSIMRQPSLKYEHIAGSTNGMVMPGASLAFDPETRENRFAAKRLLSSTHGFEGAPINPETGRPLPLARHTSSIPSDAAEKRQRFNDQNPHRQIF